MQCSKIVSKSCLILRRAVKQNGKIPKRKGEVGMRSMTRFLVLFGALSMASVAVAQNTDTSKWPQVMAPGGFIPAGSRIQVQALPADAPVFQNNGKSGPRTVESVPTDQYLKVNSLSGAKYTNPGDAADMRNRLKDGSLRVSSDQLKASAACAGSGDSQVCDVKRELSVSQSAPMEPSAFAAAVTGEPVAKAAGIEAGLVQGMGDRLNSLNSAAGKPGVVPNCEASGSAKAAGSGGLAAFLSALAGAGAAGGSGDSGSGFGGFSGGSLNKCALQKARALYEKNKGGRVKSDLMMVADFSSGRSPGKMYLVSASTGQLANVPGVPNPMDVAGGNGGFDDRGAGRGCGNNKTPGGGLVLNPYTYIGGAIVKDGMSFSSLEPSKNGSAIDCGVKLHGWNPNQFTQGCFGICGSLNGNSNLGGANYMDILKNGPLKNGGNLLYSFTPQEANDCKGF